MGSGSGYLYCRWHLGPVLFKFEVLREKRKSLRLYPFTNAVEVVAVVAFVDVRNLVGFQHLVQLLGSAANAKVHIPGVHANCCKLLEVVDVLVHDIQDFIGSNFRRSRSHGLALGKG